VAALGLPERRGQALDDVEARQPVPGGV